MQTNLAMQPKYLPKQTHKSASRPLRRPQVPPTLQARARFEQTNFCRQSLSYCRQSLSTVARFVIWWMLQTNSWTCRQTLSAAVLQTNFVCTRSPDRQTLQTNFVCRKSAKTWPKCRQILQTNFVCKKSAENWAKMQTNLVDKLCLQKIRRNLGQNADKSCRQTLSRPKIAGSCRKSVQTHRVFKNSAIRTRRPCP